MLIRCKSSEKIGINENYFLVKVCLTRCHNVAILRHRFFSFTIATNYNATRNYSSERKSLIILGGRPIVALFPRTTIGRSINSG